MKCSIFGVTIFTQPHQDDEIKFAYMNFQYIGHLRLQRRVYRILTYTLIFVSYLGRTWGNSIYRRRLPESSESKENILVA